jgi:hypothetical protein
MRAVSRCALIHAFVALAAARAAAWRLHPRRRNTCMIKPRGRTDAGADSAVFIQADVSQEGDVIHLSKGIRERWAAQHAPTALAARWHHICAVLYACTELEPQLFGALS